MDGTARTFDPFRLLPVFPKWLRRRHSAWLVLPGVAVALVLIGVTAFEGTLGSASDFQLAQDVRYIFGETVGRTEPNFPLVRDVASCFLFLVIAAGVVVLHRQWQCIAEALIRLRADGIITPRRRPTSTFLSRAMGIDRLVGECGDYEALDRLTGRMGQVRRRTKLLLAGVVLAAGLVLAALAGIGLNRGIHRVLLPTDMSVEERELWLAQARANWWAGPEHPLGLILFGLLTWFAMCLILTCNVIGLATVYLAVALHYIADLRADWYNRDGRYGWMPVAGICRTIYWCLVLLGGGISFVVAVLGPRIVFSIAGLIGLYVLLVPVYTLIPWIVFSRVERAAREQRVAHLTRAMQGIDEHDLDRVQSFVAEFARCREARINPMRLSRVPLGAFASVVLLPILLTALQIYAQGLGGR